MIELAFQKFIDDCTKNGIDICTSRKRLAFKKGDVKVVFNNKLAKILLGDLVIPKGFVEWFESLDKTKLEEEDDVDVVEETNNLRQQYETAIQTIKDERLSTADKNIFKDFKVLVYPERSNFIVYNGYGCEMEEMSCELKPFIERLRLLASPDGQTTIGHYIESKLFSSHSFDYLKTVPLEQITSDKISSVLLRTQIVDKPVYSKGESKVFQGFSLKSKSLRSYDYTDYVKDILPTLLNYSPTVRFENFKVCSNDPKEDCLCYLDITPYRNKTPYFDKWLNNVIGDKDTIVAMKAWLGSLLDAKSKVRQCLYIRGPGLDGKSVFTRILGRYFGKKFFGENCIENENQFTTSSYEHKRLVAFTDLKDAKFIHSELFHTITGGDDLRVEKKGLQPVNVTNFCRVMVATNLDPDIDTSQPNQVSRVLYVRLKNRSEKEKQNAGHFDEKGNNIGNPNFEVELESEIKDFMFQCYETYLKMCPNHGEIPPSQKMKDDLSIHCSNNDADLYDVIAQRKFEFREDLFITSTELREIFNDELSRAGKKLSDGILKRVLENRGAKKGKQRRVHGIVSNVWEGIGTRQTVVINDNKSLVKVVEPVSCEINFD